MLNFSKQKNNSEQKRTGLLTIYGEILILTRELCMFCHAYYLKNNEFFINQVRFFCQWF